MSHTYARILAGAGVFAAVCGIGVVGFVVAGWHPMDALYMVIITIFGVGYGEVRPVETVQLRLFTIGLIVAGYSAAIFVVGTFIQFLTEGQINRALGRRRMTREIASLRRHTVICGFGRIGRILAAELARQREPFVVVDDDPGKVAEAEALGYPALCGDARQEEVLRSAGVGHAKVLATALPDDAANVFISLTASGLDSGMEIIARAEDPASETKLRRGGATQVILPARIGGERMANLITRPGAEQLLTRSDGIAGLANELEQIGLRMEELNLPSSSTLIGRPIANIEIHGNRGFLIVGIRRASGEVHVNPPGEILLKAGDTVIVMGHPNDLPELRRRYAFERQITYRGARVTR